MVKKEPKCRCDAWPFFVGFSHIQEALDDRRMIVNSSIHSDYKIKVCRELML